MKVSLILEDGVSEDGALTMKRKVLMVDANGTEHDVNEYAVETLPAELTRAVMLSPAALTIAQFNRLGDNLFQDAALKVMMSGLLLKVGEVYGFDDALELGPVQTFEKATSLSGKSAEEIYDELSQGLTIGVDCPPKEALEMFGVREAVKSAIKKVLDRLKELAQREGGDVTVIDPNGTIACDSDCDCEQAATT